MRDFYNEKVKKLRKTLQNERKKPTMAMDINNLY